MRTSNALAAVAITVSLAAVAACDSSGEEPLGLDATSEQGTAGSADETTRADPAPSDTTAGGATDDETSEPAPDPAFTQPYLAEESVVELRDMIPITPPDGASDAEREVLEAYGRYEAAWEQILWGVPFEDSGMSEHAIEPNLSTIRDYAEESVDKRRVSVGPPVDEVALGVDVNGETATARVCIDNSGWVEVAEDAPPDPDDPLYLATPTLERVNERWMVARMSYSDDVSPCEGVFE